MVTGGVAPVSGWAAFENLSGDADDSSALRAARSDLSTQRQAALGTTTGALQFAPPVIDFREQISHELVVRVRAGSASERTVRLSREVIASAVAHGMRPLTLLACAIVARDQLPAGWQPRRVGEAALPPEILTVLRQVFRVTDASRHATALLDAGQDVLLVGEHGAGK